MNFGQLIELSHSTAVEKGWWEGKPRSPQEIMMLIISELAEGLEEVRNKRPLIYQLQADGTLVVPYGDAGWDAALKPEGLAVELADALIRLGDFIGYKEKETGQKCAVNEAYSKELEEYAMEFDEKEKEHTTEGMFLYKICCTLCSDLPLNQVCTTALVYLCTFLHSYLGVRPSDVVQLKMDYNRTRGHRHGGKAL